ncbi:TIGR00730 family Rossman fold protein [Candidatus Roizmanbacteria bacterium CG_4_10_14_0_2_um_filter_39_13]|uniref:Cytokinin riboside 5'-monophosphate phosphoribohydrolase n=1 Tax=Candidatus Roizmanbacteria bacterium CG_4_10_14_0_2_um_filter_39_13 TaxID=1974825 RepID=A0A2M7U146_9BACT|nr:MAG: TIGR00730 family Rossman fold protein [Candidatus Roizmanbacteria bacterium CG_4_10_14_0_2_um_filter_39_13]
MKNIAFFLSASELDEKYTRTSLELVKLSVEAGYGFVYGGTDTGLMKQAADEVEKLNGMIIGISSLEFGDKLRPNIFESHVCASIGERKKMLNEKSNAFVILPGGAGTLDEGADAIEQKKIGAHHKPIIFLNIDGFWDGLITQYSRMYTEGFLREKPDSLFFVHEDPVEILEYIKDTL